MSEATKKLTMATARQHYIDAAGMTKAELREFNKAFGWGEWLSSVKRPKMVEHYRRRLAAWITAKGGEVPET